MDGIWQKLKNHPYFKVVAAYLAGGWVLLQIAEILSPALRLPDWVLSAIAVTLIAGFPVVLIIAWIMAKPAVAARGEKLFLDGKYVDYGIAAIAGVLCLFVSFRWFFSETVSTVEVVVAPAVEAPAAVPTSTVVPPTQAPEMSIAVLPFRDMSPNADQAYFSDGVAEEIIFSLARLDELYQALADSGATVVTTTFPDVARILPVGRLLSVRVQRINAAIRTAAYRHGFGLVDLYHAPSMSQPDTWSPDRVHGSPKGHMLFAAAAAEALGLPGSSHDWALVDPACSPSTARSLAHSQVSWTQHMLVPWLWRHVRGRSSAGGRTPRRPELTPV